MTVRLIGVVEPQTSSLRGPGIIPGVRAAIEHFAEQQRIELEKALEEVAGDLEAKTVVRRTVRIRSPADEIVKSAERADLVVSVLVVKRG